MTLFEALQPDSPYVFYSDDHGFCINTADVVDILTMDKESGYHWIPCSGDMQKDDVIYRQDAIDAVKELCLHYTPTKSVRHPHIDFVVEELERLPSAQPQWIPCSERLPDSGRYLVSCSLSVFSPQVLNYDADDGEWFYDGCKSIGYEMPTINAWMPLPEPYGGESDGNN